MPKANDKDVYYFSHDCNARNDEKILALRSVYGLEGYAVYFMLIEILREQPTYRLPITKYTYNTLAMQMQCECNTIEKIVHDCCNEFVSDESSLLKIENGFLYSESLLRRMEKVDATSESRQKAANSRWNKQSKSKSNANAEQAESKGNAIRVDKSRQDETKKEKIIKHAYGELGNVFLTDDEYKKLKERFSDWQKKVASLDSYIASKGVKYKSHYATILSWANKNGESTVIQEKPKISEEEAALIARLRA